MKEWIKNNIRTICMAGIMICVMLAVTIITGVTPNDVFGGMFRYDQETEYDIGVKPYEDQSGDERNDAYKDEDSSGEKLTYEEFIANPPEFDGEHMYVTVNQNRPFFTKDDRQMTDTFIVYSPLDEKGRTGTAIGNICHDLFPEGDRTQDLSTVTPAGWNQIDTKERFNVVLTYEGESTHYLFARSHLIAYSLGGGELEERDIFTGTVGCNMTMLQFEKAILDFLDTAKEDHVLYRVTPVYKEEKDLIPAGILMEAYGIESKGLFVDFCVYVFNEQIGFDIDFSNGEVRLANS